MAANKLRITRTILATLSLVAITLLFLDFTGTIHSYIGWTAEIQLIPAILILNIGIIIGLTALTLLFGRLYCSVICPLGVFQDVVSRFNRKKNKSSYSPQLKWLRYSFLALFLLALAAGISSIVAILEPYSAYGRIVSTLLGPIYGWGNNILSYFAERVESYTFYDVDVWIRGLSTLIIAAITLIVVAILAWRGGRTYCNCICPIGTLLGLLSKFSIYKHRINTDKCNSCGLCSRNCKSSCIDPKTHTIDYTRCVTCFDCIDKCNKGAIQYKPCTNKSTTKESIDPSRRNMLTIAGALLTTSVIKAQQKKVDGGLAFIEDKKIPTRQTPIVPPGAHSIRNFNRHCTGCQLCVSVCPNQVLRPSNNLANFMQAEVSYERGYCRPECTKCSEVCPTDAIKEISIPDKSSTQIGHAVWIEKNCVVLTNKVTCGNCAKHCPSGAITMVERTILDSTHKIPIINTERCIGCGACEYLCPSRPFSAIYVEGHTMHRTI